MKSVQEIIYDMLMEFHKNYGVTPTTIELPKGLWDPLLAGIQWDSVPKQIPDYVELSLNVGVVIRILRGQEKAQPSA